MQGGQHSDPILRKMELDMAPTPSTPASSSLGPSASISSLFSKAIPGAVMSSRPELEYGRMLGDTRPSSSLSSHSSISHGHRKHPGLGEHMRPRLPRQRSLQQELYRDIPAPGHPRPRPPLARASSEGGEDALDPYSISSAPGPGHHAAGGGYMMGGAGRGYERGAPQLHEPRFRPDSRLSRDQGSYSAPEDHGYEAGAAAYNLYPRVVISDQEARDQFPMISAEADPRSQQRFLLDPNVARGMTQRKKLDASFRNDSLSSDQSEYQSRPPPPRPHKHKKMKHQRSMSSSDDEIRSTPELSEELESESVSEKDFTHAMMDRYHREELLDAKIKNFLAHPVSWQPNSDGTRSIGHMILTKSSGPGGSALLGLKVVGGKLLGNNRYGALIEKVKKGSIADSVGNLLPGDEVLEWNGRSLQDKSYEEVHEIVTESRQDDQVELIVARQIMTSRHRPMRGDQVAGPTLAVTDPLGGTLVVQPNTPTPEHAGSRLQVKTVFNQERLELIVTILGAASLPSRVNGQHRNPYAKIFLLPGKIKLFN